MIANSGNMVKTGMTSGVRAAIATWHAERNAILFHLAGWTRITKACRHGNEKASSRLRFEQSCNRSE